MRRALTNEDCFSLGYAFLIPASGAAQLWLNLVFKLREMKVIAGTYVTVIGACHLCVCILKVSILRTKRCWTNKQWNKMPQATFCFSKTDANYDIYLMEDLMFQCARVGGSDLMLPWNRRWLNDTNSSSNYPDEAANQHKK